MKGKNMKIDKRLFVRILNESVLFFKIREKWYYYFLGNGRYGKYCCENFSLLRKICKNEIIERN